MTAADGTAARCRGSFDHFPGTTVSPYFPVPLSVRVDESGQVSLIYEASLADLHRGQLATRG
jgi:hypothetical protein